MVHDPVVVSDDPILAQRARLARLASLGKQIGYGLFGLALAIFVVGFSFELRPWMATVIIGCLAIGSVVLAPAVILGYAVRAAEREEAGGAPFH